MRSLLTTAAVLFAFLGAGAAPAFAAKGVKKKTANGAHHVQGVVTHVTHHKNKTAAGHIGEITVKAHHHKKKGQAAAKGGKVKGQGHSHKFSISSNTTFTGGKGKKNGAATFASVHTGERVTVTATGGHATSVAIHHHAKK